MSFKSGTLALVSTLTLASFGCGHKSAPLPSGDYVPDVSQAEEKNRDVVKTYFQGRLHFSADGTFDLPAARQNGFWRMEKGQVVLNYSGFMGLAFDKPDAELKTAWPSTQLDGHVMKLLADGTLELSSFGACKGPIYFRRAPRRNSGELIPLSSGSDEGESADAFAILRDEAPTRWRDYLAIIQDSQVSIDDRRWTAVFLLPTIGAQGEAATLGALDTLNTKGLTDREAQSLRNGITRAVIAFANPTLIKHLLEIGAKTNISKTVLAECIGKAGYAPGIPQLVEWTAQPKAGPRAAACKALAQLNAKDAVGAVRKLSADSDARTRVAANGAILKLSADEVEKGRAVKNLVHDMTGVDYINTDVIEALGASGSKLSVPVLTRILSTGKDLYDRRKAAEELGQLGFTVALPALRAAIGTNVNLTDVGTSGGNPLMMVSSYKKAVVEAIWKLEHQPKAAKP